MKGTLMALFKKPTDPKTLIAELRKDCIYIIMLPADQRKEFIQALEGLDLTQGPEILVLDEMGIMIMEFSKDQKKTKVTQLGKVGN
jgi:hypothetical protein